MWKAIKLTQDKWAIVDAEDYGILSQYKWCATGRGKRISYAASHSPRNGGRAKTILMHRLVLKAPVGSLVDHINRNGLDNRKSNLRLCTVSQNQMNSKKMRKQASSIYKGVHRLKGSEKWKAQIKFEGKKMAVGVFLTEKEAAEAYDSKAGELFGDFARTNFRT